MPRVPSLDTFQTSLASAQPGRFDASGGPSGAEIATRQAGQGAQALQQAGNMAGRIATDMQEQANQVRVIDAVNQAKERLFDLQYGPQGYANLKGVDALQRPDGKPLAEEYGSKLREVTDSIAQSLGNDAQRLTFSRAAADMHAQLHGDALRHTAQEFRTYQSSVYDGAAKAAQQQLALNYTDVQPGGLVEQSINTIQSAVKEKARLVGMSQTEADELAKQQTSAAHRLAIKTAIERNDIGFADGYLKKFAPTMDAGDILAVQGAITKEMDLRQGVQAATSVVQTMTPKLMPTDFDRLVNITLASESSGQRYGKDGNLLTSPRGAKGEMQVLDGTNRDPGYGVTPAKDNSPEERARVGRDYLAAMLKRYAGDPAKAWAAYNAGPGALDKVLAGLPKDSTVWLADMPAETQVYVKKNMATLGSGLGTPAIPTLADVQAQVRERLGPDAKPSVLKHAMDEATRQWEVATKDKTQREEQTVAEAQRVLLANGGNFKALPPSLRSALPPGKVDDLMTYAGKIAKGEPVSTDWSLYTRLTSDPQLLKNTNLLALRDRLADAEFKQLTDHQVKLNNPSDAQNTHLQTARDVLNTYMKQAGINPNPKYDDKDANAKVGTLLSAYQQRIAAREAELGKKLDTAQLNEVAAGMFQPVKVPGFLGFSKDAPAALVDARTEVRVPDAERTQIVAALRKAGRAADDQAVEALYRARRGIPQRTAQN